MEENEIFTGSWLLSDWWSPTSVCPITSNTIPFRKKISPESNISRSHFSSFQDFPYLNLFTFLHKKGKICVEELNNDVQIKIFLRGPINRRSSWSLHFSRLVFFSGGLIYVAEWAFKPSKELSPQLTMELHLLIQTKEIGRSNQGIRSQQPRN